MTAREHAKTLGLLFWIYTGLQIFGLLIGGLFLLGMSGFMFSEFSRMPHRAGEPDPAFIFGFMGVIIVAAFAVSIILLIPEIIAAHGLRKGKSWAKIWTIIACCLAVLSFPLGTALAAYGFWFVFGEQGKAYFDNNYADKQGYSVPPPPNSWQ